MRTLVYERNPFDILVKNFFSADTLFKPLVDFKIPHPVDIYETPEGLVFDIACTGIPKEEIEILTQDDILRVNYDKKEKESEDKEFLYKGIAKRSFNLGWRITSRFDLSKAEATFNEGLLTIKIPQKETHALKALKIK